MEKNINGSNEMSELRDSILCYRNYCYGWCYTWNTDPGCLEDEDSIEDFKREIEANEIVEITDPYEREIALSQLDCDSNYDDPVYQAGGVKFITNL